MLVSLYPFLCGYSTTVSVGDFQSSDVGSIPITRSMWKRTASVIV